jgi:hypothetical protein
MVNGQYGTYCPTKLPDGHWCKGKTVSETELVEPKNESKPARAKKEKQDPPTATQGDSAGTGLFKTDLDTIKSIGDLYAASLRDFPERFKLKADVLKALGKTETEITDPANDYIVLSTQSR